MKKVFKVFMMLMLVFTITLAVGCKKDPVITGIEVVNETIPSSIYTNEVTTKLGTIKIKVLKSDGNHSEVSLSKEMISDSDYAKLSYPGTYDLTVTYEGFNTTLKLVIKTKDTGGNENQDPSNVDYEVNVKDVAGRPLGNFYVTFYDGNDILKEGYTNAETGSFTANLKPGVYDVVLEDREGYYLNKSVYKTDKDGTIIEVIADIDDMSGVEAPAGHKYQLGDVMYDFTLTDTEGNVLNLYELLETKKAVVLNFWYTTCTYCLQEFPKMVEAYESEYAETGRYYKDEVAIIAVNPGTAGNGDTLADITKFKADYNLTFNVAMDYDVNPDNLTMDPGLNSMFVNNAYPTTAIIDRYGLIAEFTEGAVLETAKWTQTFDKFISDDYVPEYKGENEGNAFEEVPDDIKHESMEDIYNAVSGTNYDNTKFTGTFAEEDFEDDIPFTWPWHISEYEGKDCIKPSNQDRHPSYATFYVNVHLKAGEALVFDYYASSESYDYLYVIVEGSNVALISGESKEWKTKYAFVAVTEDDYEVGFLYLKDYNYSIGEDAVFLTNFRIEQSSTCNEETYIYREAATGVIDEITMSWTKYINAVYNESDGYYHVNDANGPLLLANMLTSTHWNSSPLYGISLEQPMIGADGVDYTDLVEEYSVYASNSEVGFTPITKELADALKQIVKAFGDELAEDNENQWLELCCYYSAYGTNGVELGLPIIGVAPFAPIEFEGDGIDQPATAEGNLDRIILPRGLIFAFTPTISGVYRYYSEEEIETIGWYCDSDGYVIGETDNELREYAKWITEGTPTDGNFNGYIYLEAGKTYLFRACFGDTEVYDWISVAIQKVAEEKNLLTIASPMFFTSSDENMSDIISGNYIDVALGEDGYYHVTNSNAADTFVYCDMTYVNNISTYSLYDIAKKFSAFDFSKDDYGNQIYETIDGVNYYKVTGYNSDMTELVPYYVCVYGTKEDWMRGTYADGTAVEEIWVPSLNYKDEELDTTQPGYTYITFTEAEINALEDYTDYVIGYADQNLIRDENSDLYGCVKVNEEFARVLSLFMDKYTFPGVDYSWLKLCYYYRYVGPEKTTE